MILCLLSKGVQKSRPNAIVTIKKDYQNDSSTMLFGEDIFLRFNIKKIANFGELTTLSRRKTCWIEENGKLEKSGMSGTEATKVPSDMQP